MRSCGIMERTLRGYRDRWLKKLTAIRASFANAFSAVASPTGFSTQRMCPFCGLITPRAKRSCLECGRSLAPVGPG